MSSIGLSRADRDRLLRWLSQGREMAVALKGERVTTCDVVWTLFQNSVLTLDKAPDREKGWLTSGLRSAAWPFSGLSVIEAKDLERIRLLSSMVPHDGGLKEPVMREDEARSLDVMCWIRWCGVYVNTNRADRMRKAAIALARGGDTDVFHRVWSDKGRKLGRAAVSKFRLVFVGHILAGLREDCGIVASSNGYFEAYHG